MAENITVPKGLADVIVDETAIASTDSDGNLIYRGYVAEELAEKSTFEQVAYLIVYGHLPDRGELREFTSFLNSHENVTGTRRIMRLLPKDVLTIDMLRTVVSLVPLAEKDNDRVLLEIAAKMPRIISDGYRLTRGMKPFGKIRGSYAEKFYHLLTGSVDKKDARLFEELLILYMEHEFNASTFALRVTASTLADPRAAVTAALAAIKGPLHGGANAEILGYLLSLKSKEEARKYVDRKLDKKELVMGFGHRIYKAKDPRAQYLKRRLKDLALEKGAGQLYEVAVAIEDEMWEKKNIPANMDFYAAICMYLLGIDGTFNTPIFAASRSFGWAAHYLEQVSGNKLIRPSSRYVGKTGLHV
jgi:citrate synthase